MPEARLKRTKIRKPLEEIRGLFVVEFVHALHFGLTENGSRGKYLIYSPVAQSVERVAVNHHVRGSSPRWGAIKSRG